MTRIQTVPALSSLLLTPPSDCFRSSPFLLRVPVPEALVGPAATGGQDRSQSQTGRSNREGEGKVKGMPVLESRPYAQKMPSPSKLASVERAEVLGGMVMS